MSKLNGAPRPEARDTLSDGIFFFFLSFFLLGVGMVDSKIFLYLYIYI